MQVDWKGKRKGLYKGKCLKILKRDKFICQYCGEQATDVDHILPASYIGRDDDNNLVASCRECNAVANNKVFENFMEKKIHLLDKMRKRRKAYEWSREELEELGPTLRSYIEHSKNTKWVKEESGYI